MPDSNPRPSALESSALSSEPRRFQQMDEMTSIFRGFSKFNFELEILHLGGNILYKIELIKPKCET